MHAHAGARWIDGLIVCALCFLGERFGHWLGTWHGGVWAVSVTPPLLLAWLIARVPRNWTAASIGAAVGVWLATISASPAPLWSSLLLAIGLPLPPLIIAGWMWREAPVTWPPADFRRGGTMLLTLGALLPLLDVAWLYAWSLWFEGGYRQENLPAQLLTHSAGYMVLLPAAMLMRHMHKPANVHRLARDLIVALALALLPLTIWSPVGFLPLPSALMTIAATPVLLWSLVRLGLGGACVALLACGVAGLSYSVEGAGPFAGLPVQTALLSMQAWICAAGAALWLVSIMVEKQRLAALRLRAAYRQLSDLTGRVLVVQEEERTRIARDLHDDINQSLAALSIRLSYLKRNVAEPQREAVAELQQDLHRVSNDIRNMSHGLHPAMLRFTGLGSALTGFCQGHAQRSTLRIHCEVVPPEDLGDARELSLFRIVQEAVNNIEKHARAHEAWVELHSEGGQCVLSVIDDGIGLPAARRGAPAGLGLISMGERARLLGGQLTLAAREGGGTRLEVRFPLPEAVQQAQ